jgi:hypothetical protein
LRGQELAQLRGVTYSVVAIAVVHQQMRLPGLAGDVGEAVGDLLELVL